MDKVYHKNLTEDDLHPLHAWTFSDALARTTTSGVTVDDVGKVARQQDNNSFWILRDATGPIWDPINNSTTSDGQLAQGIELKDYSETVSFSNITTSGTVVLDLEEGNVFSLTLTEDISLEIDNPPASGTAGFFTLIVTEDAIGGWDITWPSSIDSGDTSINLATTAGSKTIFTSLTTDGGQSWYLMMGWKKTL